MYPIFIQKSPQKFTLPLLLLARNFLLYTLFSFQGAVLTFSRSGRNTPPLLRSNTSIQACLFGGDKRDRTADLLLARQALSQLSYTPMSPRIVFHNPRVSIVIFSFPLFSVVGPSGLEPPTSRLSVVRSNQLSYGPSSSLTSYPSLLSLTEARSLRRFSSPNQTRFRWALFGLRLSSRTMYRSPRSACVRPLN